MFINKRENGYFYIYYEVDGRRIKQSLKTKDKLIAQQRFAEFMRFGGWNKKVTTQIKKISLGDAVKEYLKLSESLNTSRSYYVKAGALKKFTAHLTTDKPLDEITVKEVNEYLQIIQRRSSSYQSRIDYINIKAMFYHFIKQGIITFNPMLSIKIPKIPVNQPLYLSREEYATLVKKSTYPINEIIVFAVGTGMRLSEILSLRDTDINRDEMSITIGVNRLTKSKKTRVIPLRGDIFEMIENKRGVLFPFKANYISKQFKKVVRSHGINDKIHFHSLRHTFASWLIQSGVSIYTVSKLLGHGDVSVTSIYANLELSNLRCGIEKIKGVEPP